jgi:hypothetical protein
MSEKHKVKSEEEAYQVFSEVTDQAITRVYDKILVAMQHCEDAGVNKYMKPINQLINLFGFINSRWMASIDETSSRDMSWVISNFIYTALRNMEKPEKEIEVIFDKISLDRAKVNITKIVEVDK